MDIFISLCLIAIIFGLIYSVGKNAGRDQMAAKFSVLEQDVQHLKYEVAHRSDSIGCIPVFIIAGLIGGFIGALIFGVL